MKKGPESAGTEYETEYLLSVLRVFKNSEVCSNYFFVINISGYF